MEKQLTPSQLLFTTHQQLKETKDANIEKLRSQQQENFERKLAQRYGKSVSEYLNTQRSQYLKIKEEELDMLLDRVQLEEAQRLLKGQHSVDKDLERKSL